MALREFGVEVDERYIRHAQIDHKDDYELGKELLNLKRAPNGFFVADDLMVIGIYRAIKEAKLKIPQDVAIGFMMMPLPPCLIHR